MNSYYIKQIASRIYLVKCGYSIGVYDPSAKYIYKKLSFLKKHKALVTHALCPMCNKPAAILDYAENIPCTKPIGRVHELGTYCCGGVVYKVEPAGRSLPTMYFLDLNNSPPIRIASMWARAKTTSKRPSPLLSLQYLAERRRVQNAQTVTWNAVARTWFVTTTEAPEPTGTATIVDAEF